MQLFSGAAPLRFSKGVDLDATSTEAFRVRTLQTLEQQEKTTHES
jgi:hypothetical protein